jgi:predicted transcriptional regulator
MKKSRKNQVAKAKWNLKEGERIYTQMEDAMLSADKSISGTVAMNYALSKLIANYKLAMRDLDIEVDDYIDSMVDFWEYQLENDEAYDRCLFDAFTEEVKDNYFKELLAN